LRNDLAASMPRANEKTSRAELLSRSHFAHPKHARAMRCKMPYAPLPRGVPARMNAPLPESHPQGPGNRHAGRQVRAGPRPRLHERRAGAGALPMLQRQRDALRARTPAGFISGYRGSPLGGYDQALWKAKKHLARQQNIVFQPGVNEELAPPRCGARSSWTCAPQQQQVRRRVRHLVRQGPGRGPLLGRVQARQHGRHHARRRDRGGRRRPRGQEQHRRAPERPHLQGLRPAGVLPGHVQDILDLGCTPSR
jgi:indolepyruvate ferredoxin oxidoreductase